MRYLNKAKPILKRFKIKVLKAYFVGGSVRDYIMQRPIHDVDITTSATPDEIESIYSIKPYQWVKNTYDQRGAFKMTIMKLLHLDLKMNTSIIVGPVKCIL